MSKIYLLFGCCLLLSIAKAQTGCQGNLGENIFTAGDFGSGSATILPTDPNIAPGYTYTTAPPPVDGSYVITNNSGNWPSIYSSWMTIPDNSSDPEGYMMVVNADFTPGLFYNQTVDGLCENTLYEFSADIINIVRLGVPNHSEPNVSFLLDNISIFSTGNVPQDEQWYNYAFTFTTGPAQTSIQLSLRNNAPGGMGNDLAIDNIAFRPCGPEALILPDEIANICEDGNPITLTATVIGSQYSTPTFQWQQSFDEGITWADIPGANADNYEHTGLPSGAYYYRYLLANGSSNLQNSKCRVVSNVKIVQVIPKFYDFQDTICEGLFLSLGDQELDMTGIYVDTFISSFGCDSIVTLDLIVQPEPNIQASFSTVALSCNDIEDGQIQLQTLTNGNPPFLFYLDQNPIENLINTDSLITNLAAGIYEIQIVDRFGCSFEGTIDLSSPPAFSIDLGEDRNILLGESVKIDVQSTEPIDFYNWLPNGLIDCSVDCSPLEWTPSEDTYLQLSAINASGCIATDDLQIRITEVRQVYIPNAFSPNGDGSNDYFTVYANLPNVQAVEQLQVFDRWGGIVFSKSNFAPNDPSIAWDGTVNGKALNNGLYTYVAKVRFLDQVIKVYAGEVNLLNQ